jgi:hypothetical protein
MRNRRPQKEAERKGRTKKCTESISGKSVVIRGRGYQKKVKKNEARQILNKF